MKINELLPYGTENLAQTVSGRVTDEADSPLPGVNVLVKALTSVRLPTQMDDLRLKYRKRTASLSLALSAYESQEVQVGTQTTL